MDRKVSFKLAALYKEIQMEDIKLVDSHLKGIQNFKKMQERRIEFRFGVVYETPQEKLRAIPEMVKDVFTSIESLEGVRLDRVHFFAFGDSSLDFEVVYFIPTGDYNQYMDTQQEINFKLVERFTDENIGFAYPTRTIYLARE